MIRYFEPGGKAGVLQFSSYLNDFAGLALKKIMAQRLCVRQIQLTNDAIPGTWQGKTPDARIAEDILVGRLQKTRGAACGDCVRGRHGGTRGDDAQCQCRESDPQES